METITHNHNNNNGHFNYQRPHPTKSRSNGNFSHAAVQKSDIGNFQAGYFVMDMPVQSQKPKKQERINKSAEKRQQRPQAHRSRSADSDPYPQQREGDSNVSQRRLQISPHRSPTRNKRNSNSPPQPTHTSQSTHIDSNNVSLSPHKPRKAPHEKRVDGSESVSNVVHVESGSPMKDKGPSPPPTRWAGPAFSNAPPPSSLPIPDFPPFSEAAPQASTTMFLGPAPVAFQELQFFPMVYSSPVPYTHYPHHGHHSFAEVGHGQSLAQLSTDLRKMLNITSEPVYA